MKWLQMVLFALAVLAACVAAIGESEETIPAPAQCSRDGECPVGCLCIGRLKAAKCHCITEN